MKCTNSVCVYSLLYDVLVSLLSPNWEYNDKAWSKLILLTKTKVVQILSTLLVLPNRPLCVFRAHPKMLHIAKRSLEGEMADDCTEWDLIDLEKEEKIANRSQKEEMMVLTALNRTLLILHRRVLILKIKTKGASKPIWSLWRADYSPLKSKMKYTMVQETLTNIFSWK